MTNTQPDTGLSPEDLDLIADALLAAETEWEAYSPAKARRATALFERVCRQLDYLRAPDPATDDEHPHETGWTGR